MLKPYFLVLCIISIKLAFAVSRDANKIKFQHYNSAKVGAPFEIELNNLTALTLSGLRSKVKTTLIIDGLMSDGRSKMSMAIKNAIIYNKQDENVIVVDWGDLSGRENVGNPLNLFQTYLEVIGNVGIVGKRVADFIIFLKKEGGVLLSDIHITGHSLGAHISGAAGEFVQKYSGEKIGKISGMDPAGPLFTGQFDPTKRLNKGDANFVDIYHSNRNTFGDKDHRTGNINVYINGGNNQPGCNQLENSEICNHSYSWKFFAASYTQNFKGCPCIGFACQCNLNCRTACANGILVGYNAPKSSTGAYHVATSNSFNFY